MRKFTFIKIFALMAILLISGSIKAQGDGQSKETAYTVSEALAAYVDGQAKANTWVSGFIVGYVDGAAIDKGSHFDLTSGEVSPSNLLMADSKTETDYTKCLVVQLVGGSKVREALNLLDNPENLGKSLKIRGSLEAYFNVAGLKSTTACDLEGSEPIEPAETKYKKTTTITSGKKYAFVVENEGKTIVAKNLDKNKNYGYLNGDNANEVNGDNITMYDVVYNFTITEVDGGYTIQDENSRYMIMQGNFNSFNVSAERTTGDTWTIEANGDGTFKITNVEMNKYIQYSGKYNSFGSYADAQEKGLMPMLYELTTGTSNIAPVVEDVNAPVEIYTINGIMVGNSLEGLESGLYLVKQGNKVRKVIK